ncbi:lamin tail domain-containing protein [Candidatus Wolfebacteria bacterium]|nr:lamin tail domain-containing protein [Candidatus Wolfebacteria bacterium]
MNKFNYFKFVFGFLAVIFIVLLIVPFSGSANFLNQLKETTSNVLSAVGSVFKSNKPEFKKIGEVDLTSNKIESVPVKKDEKIIKIKSVAKNKNNYKNAAKEIKNEVKPLENSINSNQNLEIKPEQNLQYTGGTPKSENLPLAVSQDSIVLQTSAVNTQQPTSSQQIADNNQETTANSSQSVKILINEIKITGGTGQTDNEFIELYNPSNASVDLTDWSIKRKSSSGAEYSLLAASRLEGKTIPANGYFLIANEEGYVGVIFPDVSWAKSNTIAANNTLLLYDANQNIVDKVGFGTAADFETIATANPGVNQSIQRKFENNVFVDSDNNASDFEIRAIPNPQNSLSSPESTSTIP